MTGNSLYDPLGQDRGGASDRKPWTRRLGLIGLCLGGVIAAVSAWGVWHAPRPADLTVAVAPIGPLAPPNPPVQVDPAPTPSPVSAKPVQSSEEVELESGVAVIRPAGSTAPAGMLIKVPQVEQVSLLPAPDPRLIEKTKFGLLPRRGPDGTRAADVYARPAMIAPGLPANAPRIAVFVGGMGLDRALTAAAARALPPAVSLGFAPYGGDLAQQVQGARGLGHEAILQVPMESFNEPDGMSMPRLLAVADGPKDTADNLHWQMARFVGYAGVSNFLGAKFTADAAAFEPVLKDVADRGLFYFDDGTAPRSLAASLGPPLGLPTLRADVVIDALGDPATIDAGFNKLEALARARGFAIGATTGLPTAVDRIATFAKGLAGRGMALVPVSAMVVGTESKTAR